MSSAKRTQSTATHSSTTNPRFEPKSSTVELEEMLTIEEASLMLKMSARYVRRLVAERRIVFYRLGRSVRFRPTDLASFIDSGRVEPITASNVWASLRSVA